MSTLDREPRISGGKSTPFVEPRVDPGTNTTQPPRVNQPARLAPVAPRGPSPVKR